MIPGRPAPPQPRETSGRRDRAAGSKDGVNAMKSEAIVPLLAEILEAHGGFERWRGFKRLSSTIVTGGALWGLKGIDLPPTPRSVTTELHRQWASFMPFGEDDWTMTWTPERVVIQQASDVIAERYEPRKAFEGHSFDTPWDPLHLAYFNGYAMWTYHALPFALGEPGYEVREIEAIVDQGEVLRGLGARFPEDVHSHCRDQRFYFGADRLLRRHDYEVDVWAGTAAAHYLSDYVEAGGLRLPSRRRVYPREADGSIRRDLETVTIDISDYAPR
jgi:hypothetical protein